MTKTFRVSRGFPYPFGASKQEDGFNFSLFSKHAQSVSLCLFQPDDTKPFVEIKFDPKKNKTGYVWHLCVHGLPPTTHYGYRVDGPYDPAEGLYFDSRTILLDPFAKLVCSRKEWGTSRRKDTSHLLKGVVYPYEPFDWEEDTHLNLPMKDLIIYEMHVRGFTIDPSSGVKNPGTYLGMIEKIPYLKSLGVNAVELMPIHEFNERDNPRKNPLTNEPLFQYWGYSTVNFFAPMNRFSTKDGNPITELKTLIKALHAEGIEVILDVVYNHTSEGDKNGPILSFKGLENPVYYMLTPNADYYNFSGCGNTFNCNHPIVRHFILDSLRYWVTEMHVDGFRFDLASILVRSHDGIPLERPPLIEAISVDPVLSTTKLIAEAWDAGGLYQVGSFPGLGIWSEWNGKYRDGVRRFIKGTDGESGHFATRISGSEDLYGRGKNPLCSINFIVAHDGFTLADLVSYNDKHNEENGEENRDGTNANDSWNCGAEGETQDETILALRQRQMRNFHLALMISRGIPMILMGDEYCHTKNGNNNSWTLDTRINWFQWDQLEKNKDFFRFYTGLIQFRKTHSVLIRPNFLRDHDVLWHGREPMQADWSSKNRFLALTLPSPHDGYELYIAFNASHEPAKVHLPDASDLGPWKRIVDTSKPSPEDYLEEQNAVDYRETHYELPEYSALLLKRPIAKT